jgi:hypothetical protein
VTSAAAVLEVNVVLEVVVVGVASIGFFFMHALYAQGKNLSQHSV